MDLSLFENTLILKGLRPYTIQCHLQRIRQILTACDPLSEVTFQSFIISKRKENVKANSLNRLIITLRHYAACHDLEWGIHFPLLREQEPVKAIFSDDEIEFIISLQAPPRFRKDIWYRWTVWLQVLAFSGMRASEVSTLTVNQVDWGSNNFILPNTKTTPRRVPIASILKPILQEYLKTVDYYLFPVPSKRGHVWRQGWQKHMSERIKIADIQREGLTTHSFRHSFISNLWEESVPLPDIMNIVGHKKAETTLRYSHLGNKSAQKSINKHSIIRKHTSPLEQLEFLVEEAKKSGLLNSDEFEWVLSRHSLHIEIKEKK